MCYTVQSVAFSCRNALQIAVRCLVLQKKRITNRITAVNK